jgi:ubiquinone/menaquinone biosynthesis C-methylase UbiE
MRRSTTCAASSGTSIRADVSLTPALGAPAVADFTTVTEVPGLGASAEQVAMLHTRYAHAAPYCRGKDVLELACGSAIGLGALAPLARRVVGADRTAGLLHIAARSHEGRLPLVQLDAHALPFADASHDVVIIYEAIYYFTDAARVVGECRRILRDNGVLLLCTVNKEWADFNPSPYSARYFSAAELASLLGAAGFVTDVYGAFPIAGGARNALVSFIKRRAVALGAMPRTMTGKRMLKRLFLGPLRPLPAVLATTSEGCEAPVRLAGQGSASAYKVVYAVARIARKGMLP